MPHHLRRLAVISTHTSPLARPGTTKAGGMNVYVAELAKQLASRERIVDIYTRRDRPDLPAVVEIAPGARVVHVDVGPPTVLPPIEVAAHIDAFTARVDQIARERGWSYELLHSHYWVSGLSGIALAQRWGRPHAATFHTLGEIKNRHYCEPEIEVGRPEPAIRIAGEHHVASCADLLIPWTAHERDFLVDFYRADPSRIRIVPGGVDLERFHSGDRAAAREIVRRQLPGLCVDDAPTILFVGRLERLKGVDLLIEALAQLRRRFAAAPPRLWIIGGDERDAAERARLRALAEALGVADRLSMQDAAPHALLPHLYRAADVCAMPSAYESFGLVTVEAMACGTPAVASGVGGLLTTISDGRNGYLAPQRTAAAFAERLARVLGAPDRGAAMGLRAAASVRRYAWPVVAERMLELYESLLAEPERDPSSPCAEAAETLLAGAGL